MLHHAAADGCSCLMQRCCSLQPPARLRDRAAGAAEGTAASRQPTEQLDVCSDAGSPCSQCQPAPTFMQVVDEHELLERQMADIALLHGEQPACQPASAPGLSQHMPPVLTCLATIHGNSCKPAEVRPWPSAHE